MSDFREYLREHDMYFTAIRQSTHGVATHTYSHFLPPPLEEVEKWKDLTATLVDSNEFLRLSTRSQSFVISVHEASLTRGYLSEKQAYWLTKKVDQSLLDGVDRGPPSGAPGYSVERWMKLEEEVEIPSPSPPQSIDLLEVVFEAVKGKNG